ncbi:MAG: hypothetical protein HQL29_00815 [Candidatus Omnitrophica bacterium]|nr:hypothetical protein [Candidatus Omnitrophota bacterium]
MSKKDKGIFDNTGYYTGLMIGKVSKFFSGVDTGNLKENSKKGIEKTKQKVDTTINATKDVFEKSVAVTKDKIENISKVIKEATGEMVESFKSGYNSCEKEESKKTEKPKAVTPKQAEQKKPVTLSKPIQQKDKEPVKVSDDFINDELETEISKIEKKLKDI